MTERIPFCTPVVVTARYDRITTHIFRSNDKKTWRKKPFTAPRHGVLIGYRTISNGERWFEDEVGHVYEPKEYLTAALVVFNERENPVLVPLDAVT